MASAQAIHATGGGISPVPQTPQQPVQPPQSQPISSPADSNGNPMVVQPQQSPPSQMQFDPSNSSQPPQQSPNDRPNSSGDPAIAPPSSSPPGTGSNGGGAQQYVTQTGQIITVVQQVSAQFVDENGQPQTRYWFVDPQTHQTVTPLAQPQTNVAGEQPVNNNGSPLTSQPVAVVGTSDPAQQIDRVEPLPAQHPSKRQPQFQSFQRS